MRVEQNINGKRVAINKSSTFFFNRLFDLSITFFATSKGGRVIKWSIDRDAAQIYFFCSNLLGTSFAASDYTLHYRGFWFLIYSLPYCLNSQARMYHWKMSLLREDNNRSYFCPFDYALSSEHLVGRSLKIYRPQECLHRWFSTAAQNKEKNYKSQVPEQ